MRPSTTNRWVLIIIFILLLIIILLLIFRCCRQCGRPQGKPKAYPSEVIVMKNPDASTADFQAWVQQLTHDIQLSGEISDTLYCANCDSDLFLLKGPGPEAFIQQTAPPGGGGSPPPNPVGKDAPGLYCANINLTDPTVQSLLGGDTPTVVQQSKNLKYQGVSINRSGRPGSPIAYNSANGYSVTVAVFDTGKDTTAIQNDYDKGVPQTCIADPASTKGWNFAAIPGNPDTRDQSTYLHGAKVTQFIIDQVQQYQSAPDRPGTINFLPVKVFDNSGKGSLYDILCGVAWAAKSGAKLINASFGFYQMDDTSANKGAAVLMQKYLGHYLIKNNILMVAAAGNARADEDISYWKMTGNYNFNPRNLDSNYFYPAWFAKAPLLKNNVLTVTTVSSGTENVSPLQNFSNTAVDIGVDCEAVVYFDGVYYYNFSDPIFTGIYDSTIGTTVKHYRHAVTGSSFATPIVTGKIATYYERLIGAAPPDKDKIIRLMTTGQFGPSQKPFVIPNPKLTTWVRNGNTSIKKE